MGAMSRLFIYWECKRRVAWDKCLVQIWMVDHGESKPGLSDLCLKVLNILMILYNHAKKCRNRTELN